MKINTNAPMLFCCKKNCLSHIPGRSLMHKGEDRTSFTLKNHFIFDSSDMKIF